MWSFYPSEKETRLVSISDEQLYEKFEKHIKPLKGDALIEDSKDFLFNGVWNKNGFSVSIKLKIGNNFIPVINDNFLMSEEGILIKMTYDFFPATKKLLMFWTILTLSITLFFVGIYQAWLYGAISFGFCLVNYILSIENFKIQVRKSKRMFEKMLS